MQFISRGLPYLHGGEAEVKSPSDTASKDAACKDTVRPTFEWKANEDGGIPCPPDYMDGCGDGLLELRCILSENFVSELVKKGEEIADAYNLIDMSKIPGEKCSCSSGKGVNDLKDDTKRKAASREDSDDNYLYCPKARDIQHEDLKHFRWHWIRGEPVIVSNVLETTSGLSWEPLVMWRACRQMNHTKHGKHLEVKAIDCLDWCEVSVVINLLLVLNTHIATSESRFLSNCLLKFLLDFLVACNDVSYMIYSLTRTFYFLVKNV